MDFWDVIYENVEKKPFLSQHISTYAGHWHFEVLFNTFFKSF